MAFGCFLKFTQYQLNISALCNSTDLFVKYFFGVFDTLARPWPPCGRITKPWLQSAREILVCSVYFQFLNIEMVVFKVLREFAISTRIHGFKFLVSPKSSSGTKIIWAISIVVALSYASWEMRNSVISKYIPLYFLFLEP